MSLVFATHNPNKILEIKNMVPASFKLIGLEDVGCFDSIAETGSTIEQNARIKADYVTDRFGNDCFADDTGLFVNSLDGAPGVFSARYAGLDSNSEKNVQKLLSQLENKSDRQAQFKTVIALNMGGQKFLFEGVCRGTILKEKRGNAGFGYDCVFEPHGHKKSFAQMTLDEKNKISHRKKAVDKLVQFLNSNK